MIKVFVEVQAIKPGGGPFGYTYNFLKGYERLNDDDKLNVEIITQAKIDKNRSKSNLIIAKINFSSKIKKRFKRYIPNIYYRIKLRLSEKWKLLMQCDIVIFHGFQNSIVIEEVSKYVKTVYMPHSPTIAADELLMNSSLYETEFSDIEYRNAIEKERKLINNASYVVFPSKGASEEYYRYFDSELNNKKIKYIASGVDVPENAYNVDSVNNDYDGSILFAGRYVSHKGYDLFCKAAEIVVKENKSISFVSIGGGPLTNNEFVKDLSWQENPYPFIMKSSIIVIPNKSAFYDLFPLECAALGKPLVLTEVGGNKDQLLELPDTIGCSIKVADLANAILRAYEFKSQNPEWGINNKIKYEEFYNSEIFTKRWIRFLVEISSI